MVRLDKKNCCKILTLFLILQFVALSGTSAATSLQFTKLIVFTGHHNSVGQVVWSPDGTKVASGSQDGTIRIWDIKNSKNLLIFYSHSNAILGVAWNPDGKEIASSSLDNTVIIWNSESGEKLLQIILNNTSAQALAWNPNGTILALGCTDGTTRLFDYKNNQTLDVIKDSDGPDPTVNFVGWCNKGNELIYSPGPFLKVRNVSSGQELINMSNPGSFKTLNSKSTRLAVFDDTHPNAKFTIFEITGFKDSSSFDIGNYIVYSMAYSPDGTEIAVGVYDTKDSNILLIDSSTGKILDSIYCSSIVDSLAWSPNGKKMASGLDDNTVIIWGQLAPEVHLVSVSAEKEIVNIGDGLNITISVQNVGNADASNIKVDLYDGSIILSTNYLDVSSNHLSGVKYYWTIQDNAPLGLHQLRAVLGDEEKNITVQVDSRPRPNAYVVNITVDFPNITIGKTIKVIAVVANNGTADATNVNVSFYADKTLLKTIRTNISKDGAITCNLEWNTKNMTIGNHTLKVIVENSSKQMNVHIKPGPANKLDLPFPIWIIVIIVTLVICVILTYGYFYHQKQKRILE
jgi:WD40 repeat protein